MQLVKLATPTFSRSVSDALQFLSDSNMKGFTQCSATIEFIRQACKLLIANVVYITLFCAFVLYPLFYMHGVKCSVLFFLFILCFSYFSPFCYMCKLVMTQHTHMPKASRFLLV